MARLRLVVLLSQALLLVSTLASGSEPGQAPALSAAENSTFSRVIGKAFQAPLVEADLDSVRSVCQHYTTRTGIRMSRAEVTALGDILTLTYRYNVELGRCLLLSLDSGQPFVSKAYGELAQQMVATGYARKGKIDADRSLLVSTARRTRSTNEFGEEFAPLTRGSILASNAHLETVKPNFDKIAQVLGAFAN
ncbi:MAG: hypothetical protein IPK97_13410 [Ahniella sp.]|nr:hypothetical protein [Ahniella sp.]